MADVYCPKCEGSGVVDYPQPNMECPRCGGFGTLGTVTRQQAETAQNFEHVTLKNADGTPMRARRNGKTKTWKRSPGVFRIPVKCGLRDCFSIGNDFGDNTGDWVVVN